MASLHQGYSIRKEKNVDIQSSQMYRHSSWNIIFLHTTSSSIVSLRRHMENLGKDSWGLSHKDLGSTKVTEKLRALPYTVCVPAYNPNPKNILCCSLLHMTDLSCYACRNGYYIVNPCKLEPDNKQIIKDDPTAPDSQRYPAMLSSKDEDRWANECCCSVHSQPKQQQQR